MLGLVTVACLFSGSIGASSRALTEQTTPHWRDRRACGAVALYAFLGGHGYRVSYPELAQRLPIGDRGTTLLDLARVAQRHGCPASATRLTLPKLRRLVPPVILLVDVPDAELDHYVVWLGLSGDGLHRLMDPTSLSTFLVAEGQLRARWTGYAVAALPENLVRLFVGHALVGFGATLVLVLLGRRVLRRRLTAAAVLLASLFPSGCSGASAQSQPPEWSEIKLRDRPLAVQPRARIVLSPDQRAAVQRQLSRFLPSSDLTANGYLHALRLLGDRPEEGASNACR